MSSSLFQVMSGGMCISPLLNGPECGEGDSCVETGAEGRATAQTPQGGSVPDMSESAAQCVWVSGAGEEMENLRRSGEVTHVSLVCRYRDRLLV